MFKSDLTTLGSIDKSPSWLDARLRRLLTGASLRDAAYELKRVMSSIKLPAR
jgi:hypothetical protein